MLPEKMQLVVIKQTAKQFHAVSHLMHRQDVTELIIATDAGREGELVARWIMQKAGWKGKQNGSGSPPRRIKPFGRGLPISGLPQNTTAFIAPLRAARRRIGSWASM